MTYLELQQRKQQALDHLQGGRLDQALALFTELSQQNLGDAQTWHLLSAVHGMMGHFAESAECARRVIGLDAGAFYAYNNLGLAQKSQGDLESARESFQRALALNPRDPETHNNLGVLFYEQGDLDAAEENFRAAITNKQEYFQAHNNLGNVLVRRGRHEEALACYEQAVALQPGYVDGICNVGNACKALHRSAKAVEAYQLALKLNPGCADAAMGLGDIAAEARKFDVAQNCYQAVLDAYPNHARARTAMGRLFSEQGRQVEAVECWRRAIMLDPGCIEAHYLLAGYELDRGHKDQAIAAFKEVLRLDPTNAIAAYMIAAVSGGATPEGMPAEVVVGLFDSYADKFDATLKGHLGYRIPEQLTDDLAKLLDAPVAALDVLDLGCGTGLCGALLRPWARRMIGVDLAPRMLDEARKLSVYDDLILGDVLIPLQQPGASYDLIISTDVFIYVGKIDAVIRACKQVLTPHGHVAFSIELHAGPEDYVLRTTGRYAHSESYIERLADEHALEVACRRKVDVRQEKGIPIEGMIYILAAKAHPVT